MADTVFESTKLTREPPPRYEANWTQDRTHRGSNVAMAIAMLVSPRHSSCLQGVRESINLLSVQAAAKDWQLIKEAATTCPWSSFGSSDRPDRHELKDSLRNSFLLQSGMEPHKLRTAD